MGQMDIRLTEMIFSDYPNLTLTTEDFTADMATLSFNGESFTRHDGSVGSILSAKLYIVGSISIKCSKESPKALEFWKQWKKNSKLTGTATFNADIEGIEGTFSKIGFTIGEIAGDGNNPALEVIVTGDLKINSELVV